MTTKLTPKRVLIVDDNEVIRCALAGLIRGDERFVVVGQVTNGQAALAAIRSLRPDLVCLDVQMREIDGLSVLEEIRETNAHIRVVMVSAHSTPSIVKKALDLGARGFVRKPFNAGSVLQALHRAIA